MDVLENIVKQFSTGFFSAKTEKSIDGVLKIFPELSLNDNDWETEDFAFGIYSSSLNPRSKAAHYDRKKDFPSSESVENETEMEQLQFRLKKELGSIRKIIITAKKKYVDFVRNPCSYTWKIFSLSSLDINDQMDRLYMWITKESIWRSRLMDDLAVVCNMDVQTYSKPQETILITYAQGCFLRITFLYFSVFPEQSFIPSASTTVTVNEFSKEGKLPWPDNILSELEKMKECNLEVISTMKKKLRDVKIGFLWRKCGDSAHSDCGAKNDRECSELGSKIFKTANWGVQLDPHSLAFFIAKELRESYPDFRWSVISTDSSGAKLRVCPDSYSDTSLKGIDLKQANHSQQEGTKNTFSFEVMGLYGCFTYVQRCSPFERTIFVFWADPAAIRSTGVSQESSRMLKSWQDNKTSPNSTNTIFQLELPAEGTFGMDLAVDELTQTFPVCVGNDIQRFLVWPKSGTEPQNILVEEKLEVLYYGKNRPPVKVYKGRLQNSFKDDFVAIKEIELAIDQQKRTRQIRNLDCNLSYLRSLKHPNIVEHFGFQAVLPHAEWQSPLYQVIMELCVGGSLTERVTREVSLHEIIKWGQDILMGLSYLHSQGIAHKDIRGDHIMFSGPEKGKGSIKIVSVGRINSMLSQTDGSYVLIDESATLPFQPPEVKRHIGRGTDIWSFGCVLIQIIEDRLPTLLTISASIDGAVRAVNVPNIPQNLPSALDKVIRICLDLEYDKRPTAATLLRMSLFSENNYRNAAWTRPVRKNNQLSSTGALLRIQSLKNYSLDVETDSAQRMNSRDNRFNQLNPNCPAQAIQYVEPTMNKPKIDKMVKPSAAKTIHSVVKLSNVTFVKWLLIPNEVETKPSGDFHDDSEDVFAIKRIVLSIVVIKSQSEVSSVKVLSEDLKHLKSAFQTRKFRIEENPTDENLFLSRDDFCLKLQEHCSQNTEGRRDAHICVVMSNGDDDFLFTLDGKISIDSVTHCFFATADSTKSSIPHVLIVQTTEVDAGQKPTSTEKFCARHQNITGFPLKTDCLFALAHMPNYLSLPGNQPRSYVHALAQRIEASSSTKVDLNRILTAVQKDVSMSHIQKDPNGASSRPTMTVLSTLTKDFLL